MLLSFTGPDSLRFAREPSPGLRVLIDGIGQEFEGDEAMQSGVRGLVDHTHAPAAELLQGTIVRYCLADHGVGTLPLGFILGDRPLASQYAVADAGSRDAPGAVGAGEGQT